MELRLGELLYQAPRPRLHETWGVAREEVVSAADSLPYSPYRHVQVRVILYSSRVIL